MHQGLPNWISAKEVEVEEAEEGAEAAADAAVGVPEAAPVGEVALAEIVEGAAEV